MCRRCLMDNTASEFQETKTGCNFCDQAKKAIKENKIEKQKLNEVIDKIKQAGQDKEFDILCGLSGGVDSSTTLIHAIKLGLRPLCFSLDNKWNDPVADENVKKLVEKLGVSWEKIDINIPKYQELQSAFLQGGIKNVEAVTDHILFAVTYDLAVKEGIKYIVSGGNTETESIMPASWGEDPRDLYWIKSVYKKMTRKNLKGLPTISLLKEQYYRLIKRIKFVRLLDYFDYNRIEAEQMLINDYGFQSTGGKHEENIFTKWYQNFFLVEKYGIDKRKAFYSSLISSGQMTREQALKLLSVKPEYPDIGLKEALTYPKKTYSDYTNSAWVRKIVVKIYKFLPKWIK